MDKAIILLDSGCNTAIVLWEDGHSAWMHAGVEACPGALAALSACGRPKRAFWNSGIATLDMRRIFFSQWAFRLARHARGFSFEFDKVLHFDMSSEKGKDAYVPHRLWQLSA